ncbi:Crp/Fnr family transcriptional regulator [Mucilaginibacter robiniae]|uniref:Crp/Fnr family transcriptional regulator n=1 Tax=Mucilaginibacter robiniae TaxID=2728022 RepID=A0A7L5DZQ5_9SPHI|nr:Crp/Fnr family transcriptional regulator [Mucilaginibacter robiniae]QJD96600.1 Crp/Fnr family transcriptional regulator [Mucilaginibacter robiniae]
MFAEFETYIKEKAELSDAAIKLISSAATSKTLRKGQVLLQQGEICRCKIFILNGLLRAYRTKEDGSEHVMQFSPESSWTTEPESYNNLTPSSYTIDALENSEVILWTKRDFDNLFEQIPELRIYSEKLIFNNLNLSRQRIFNAISLTTEEKYDDFIRTHPSILARVPLHMVASYLGISVKTLSRIRHAQLKR